eukprot:scaffold15425_cov110-Isochrysis_galbana.AAC.5
MAVASILPSDTDSVCTSLQEGISYSEKTPELNPTTNRRDAACSTADVVPGRQLPPRADPVLPDAGAARFGHSRARRLHVGGRGVGPVAQLPNRDGALTGDGVEHAVGRVEEDRLDSRPVPAQAGRRVARHLVYRVDTDQQVGPAARHEQRVGRPAQAKDVVAVAAKGAVQCEGGEGALERRRGPDLHEPARAEGDPLAVGREGDGRHLGLEVQVGNHHAPADVGQQQVALVVDGEQDGTVGRQGKLRDVPPRLKREGEAARADQVETLHAVADCAVEDVSGRAKDERPLPVHSAAQVAEPVGEPHRRCCSRRDSLGLRPAAPPGRLRGRGDTPCSAYY